MTRILSQAIRNRPRDGSFTTNTCLPVYMHAVSLIRRHAFPLLYLLTNRSCLKYSPLVSFSAYSPNFHFICKPTVHLERKCGCAKKKTNSYFYCTKILKSAQYYLLKSSLSGKTHFLDCWNLFLKSRQLSYVLVTVLLLWRVTITKPNLIKEIIWLVLGYSFWDLVHYHHDKEHGVRQE